MNNYPDAIVALNHLLGRNRDAQKGYVEVSNNISNPDFSKWLVDHTSQRERVAEELEVEINKLGGEPVEGGTLQGALHRVWIDLKSYWTDNDVQTLLEEAERGETRAVEDYEHVLEYYKMPESTAMVLVRHRDRIKLALENIKTLKSMHIPAEMS
jgi:uncharacterized protein (TIGR02284 family)